MCKARNSLGEIARCGRRRLMWGIIRRLFNRRTEPSEVPRPDILSKALRHTSFDPRAKRDAELLSGGFMYSDEMPARWYRDTDEGGYAFRFLIGFRGSLIRQEPMEHLRPIWDEVYRLCPHWPGFRSERCDPTLREELEHELRRNCRSAIRALRQAFGKARGKKSRLSAKKTDTEPNATADFPNSAPSDRSPER